LSEKGFHLSLVLRGNERGVARDTNLLSHALSGKRLQAISSFGRFAARCHTMSSGLGTRHMILPLLRLFVYGSLKRGFNNHDRYCRGVRSTEDTHTPGKLYRLPTGYPALVLPASRLLARGTGDPLADVEVQERLGRKLVQTRTGFPNPLRCGNNRVYGELLTFVDPAGRLRAIDSLEEFRPGHKSRYERVLIAVYSRCRQGEVLAWTYVAGPLSPQRRLIPTGRWAG
jgi:gamma-glutamylcyclotransferase (GGCT)/AIG2-like uncharacterized protein YtfP